MTSHNSLYRVRAVAAALLLGGAATVAFAQQNLVGNADRGERFFTDGYKCYACHGYDGVSGARRLVPMNYTQDGFITFVQNSPLPQMPAYNDMPAQALADVYAYIRSIPEDTADIDDLPLLKQIMDRKLEAIER